MLPRGWGPGLHCKAFRLPPFHLQHLPMEQPKSQHHHSMHGPSPHANVSSAPHPCSGHRPFNNSLSIADVLYSGEVTLSLVRVLKLLSDCQRKNAPDVYVAYTVRSQDTGKLFITELGQFPTLGGFKSRADLGLAPQHPSLPVL